MPKCMSCIHARQVCFAGVRCRIPVVNDGLGSLLVGDVVGQLAVLVLLAVLLEKTSRVLRSELMRRRAKIVLTIPISPEPCIPIIEPK